MRKLKWFHILAIALVALVVVPLTPVYPGRAYYSAQMKPEVVLTLDDGYRCWVDTVLPILVKYDLKATFYITDPDYRERFTWEDARKLNEAGMEIGWHTVHHPELDITDDQTIINDLSQAASLFQSHGLPPPETFAYPAGKHDSRSIAIVSRYFKAARTTHQNVNTPHNVRTDTWHLKAYSFDAGVPFLKGFIRKYYKTDALVILFGHTVGEIAPWQSAPNMTVEDFEEFAKFLYEEQQAGNIDVVTLKDGVSRMKQDDFSYSWVLAVESPFDAWSHFRGIPIPRRYWDIYKTVVRDFIGHRFPQITRQLDEIIGYAGGQ